MSFPSTRPAEALSADLERTRRTRELVEQLIAQPSLLGPDFTPIRQLHPAAPASAPVLGWKATGRGTPGSDVEDTLSLLAQAAELGLVERLDWAFRAHTFDVCVEAGLTAELHLTPEPETFGTACPPRLAVAVLRGRRALSVCAEVHDDALRDERRLLAAAEEMHGWGWHLVLADLSGTPAEAPALRLMSRLRPAYVHVHVGRAGGAGSEWCEAAQEVGAQLLAVGVDTPARLEAALEVGAVYGRGTLLGGPSAVPA